MKASFVGGLIVAVSLAASWASAVDLPVTRTDESNMTGSACIYCEANGDTDSEYDTPSDSVLATTTQSASASDPGATATGSMVLTMECSDDWDETTYAPWVYSETEREATARGTEEIDHADSELLDSASGTARFQVGRNGNVTTGTLNGLMELESTVGGGALIMGGMNATCGSSYVEAVIGEPVWDWDGWTITGWRETLGGGEEISEYVPSRTLDIDYVTAELTEEDDYHDLAAGSGVWGRPVIDGVGYSYLDWELYAAASFEIAGD